MRAAIFRRPGTIDVGEQPDPVLQGLTDAVVRVYAAMDDRRAVTSLIRVGSL